MTYLFARESQVIGHQSAASAELSLTLATSQSKFVLVALCHFGERSSIGPQLALAFTRTARVHTFNHHAALLVGTLRELRGIGCEHGGDGLREIFVVLGGAQQRLEVTPVSHT
jgi:hypothetical protein